jgi:hypothetical protein
VGRIEDDVGVADVVDVSDIMELMPIRAAVQAGVGAVPANILNLMGTRKCGKNNYCVLRNCIRMYYLWLYNCCNVSLLFSRFTCALFAVKFLGAAPPQFLLHHPVA